MRMKYLGQESLMKLVKTHGNAKLVKRMRKPKESKWAKDAQEKSKRDTGTHKQENQRSFKPLGERINGRPKEARQD